MDDIHPTKATRRRQTGRSGLARLDGLDLRTRKGRAFKAAYAALIAEYPDHEALVRQLAGLKTTIAQTTLDTLSPDRSHARQARRVLVPLIRVAESLEQKLKATKAPAEPEKAAPQNFAAWLAQREGGQ